MSNGLEAVTKGRGSVQECMGSHHQCGNIRLVRRWEYVDLGKDRADDCESVKG